jgi:hypothetical protein
VSNPSSPLVNLAKDTEILFGILVGEFGIQLKPAVSWERMGFDEVNQPLDKEAQ